MWVLGLGMRSVSSKLYAKEHLLRSWQVTTTFSMRSVSQLKGVDYQDGCVRVRRLNSLIDFPVSLCSWSERLLFSSPFTIVRIEYCACCHEYLRVLSVTQCPATLPCSSAVRGQPGQGASLLCESGFSWLVSTEVVPPLVPATAGCWEMFHYLGDSEALSSLVRLIISADYTCIVHLAMMSWMSHRQVRKLAILGFFPICWSHEPMFFLCMHLSCANTPGKETQSSKAKKAKRENQTS